MVARWPSTPALKLSHRLRPPEVQNPRTPGTGISGVRMISLGSDMRIIPESGTPYQARAVLLDRAADLHLQRGQISIAERLARLASEVAEMVR